MNNLKWHLLVKYGKNTYAYETNLIQPMTILNKRYLLCIASIFFCIFFVSGQEEVKLNLLRPIIKQLTQIVLGMEKN